MSLKQILFTVSGISVIPLVIKHFDIKLNNEEELFKNINKISSGTKGLLKYSFNEFKNFLEFDDNKED